MNEHSALGTEGKGRILSRSGAPNSCHKQQRQANCSQRTFIEPHQFAIKSCSGEPRAARNLHLHIYPASNRSHFLSGYFATSRILLTNSLTTHVRRLAIRKHRRGRIARLPHRFRELLPLLRPRHQVPVRLLRQSHIGPVRHLFRHGHRHVRAAGVFPTAAAAAVGLTIR